MLLFWASPTWADDVLRRPRLERKNSFEIEYGTGLLGNGSGALYAHTLQVGWSMRFDRLALGLQTGMNYFRVPLFETQEHEFVGVWNFGPLLRWISATGKASSQVGAGVSIAVEPAAVDARAGALGFYLDARPLGFRLPLCSDLLLGLDPLSAALRVPDTNGVPLVEVQFLTYVKVLAER